jgi:hypothetical protein
MVQDPASSTHSLVFSDAYESDQSGNPMVAGSSCFFQTLGSNCGWAAAASALGDKASQKHSSQASFG